MRDIVEIGIGREARWTYELDDIAFVSTRHTRSSKDVDTSWRIDAYDFELPMMMYPTDVITSPEPVTELVRLDSLAVLGTESIWVRHADVQDKIAELVELVKNAATKRGSEAVSRRLQELYSAPIGTDLLVERIGEIRATGMITTVYAPPQHARELVPLAIKAGISLLIIQGTSVSAEHITVQREPLDPKDFTDSLDVPAITSGVIDHQTALYLMRLDIAGVIIGTDFTTSPDVLGIDVPMITAIMDVAAARKNHLDETEDHYVHITTGGGIDTVGDIAEAIACGTDAVAPSSVLATVDEVPRQGYA